MNKISYTWRIFSVYILILIFVLICSTAFGQIKVIQFNADWNKANQVEWTKDLSDCEKNFIDVGKDGEAQKKYKIAVLPTIIIFKDDEEVVRFQAGLSFKMLATKEEVQEAIDEQLMSDF
jgi:thiol-disulfide isomerase/thioredoxin|tara:strand:+ start:94 stop:453 length:360 start_codon:yes stop_codon:yes gene_type:complete